MSLSRSLALCFVATAACTVAMSARQDAPTREPMPRAAAMDEDVLTVGRAVHVRRDVAGDVAAAGADVLVDGGVGGYVMSAGRHVTLAGTVGNDIWAAGETVDVMGSVANNAMIAGRTVTLQPNATISGSARLAGDTVRAEGRITHDLRVAGNTVSIGGEVGGTVRARGERIIVASDAVIRGDLITESPRPPDISPRAQILGAVHHEPARARGGWMSLSWPAFWLWSCRALLVLGAAALLLAPAWPREVASVLRARPSASLLTGFVVLILFPAAVVALAITVVGIPLAIVALAFFVVVFILSVVFVSFRLGDWILARAHHGRTSRWAPMALGAVAMSLVLSLPIVGAIGAVLAVMWGAGAIFLERRAHGIALTTLGT